MIRIETAIKKLMRYYEQAKNYEWVNDKVAWALYQTWKDVDERNSRHEQ